MRVEFHANRHTVESVVVDGNLEADLLWLTVTQREPSALHETTATVTMGREVWQQVADKLAAQGIVAESAAVVPF